MPGFPAGGRVTSTGAKTIEPFFQLRERHKIDDSFWLDFRQNAGRLTFRDLRFGPGAFVGRKRFADIDGFSKGAVRLAADITFIAFVGFKQFPGFTGPLALIGGLDVAPGVGRFYRKDCLCDLCDLLCK